MVDCHVEQYEWLLRRGDDSERVFEYLDPDDEPIDLTGATAQLLIDIGLVGETITCTVDGPAGKVTAKITDTISATLYGAGEFRVRVTMAGGDKKTIIVGAIKVLA